MTDWTHFADAANAKVTLEPGIFRGEALRNNGPAVLFGNGSGGSAVVAGTKAELIAAFEDILARIKGLPEPAPDAQCRNCGRPIRYPNAEDGPQWLHRPYWTRWFTFEDWTEDCTDDEGDYVMSNKDILVAQPATDPEAVAQPGDQVLDMIAIREDYPEMDQVVRVWEDQSSGHITLDNDHVRTVDEVLVITRYVPEEQES